MEHIVSRELHGYWSGLLRGRTAPERDEVDPAAIRRVLPYTFLLEVTASAAPALRSATFRLSGTRVDALFRQGLKGRRFRDIWTDRDAALAEAGLDEALDRQSAVVCRARGAPEGCRDLDVEILLLPLTHYGRSKTRLLGSLAPHGHPSWLGLRTVEGLAMDGFRALPTPLAADVRAMDATSAVPSSTDEAAARPPGEVDAAGFRRVGPFKVLVGGLGGRPRGRGAGLWRPEAP